MCSVTGVNRIDLTLSNESVDVEALKAIPKARVQQRAEERRLSKW